VTGNDRLGCWLLAVVLSLLGAPAQAQSNLDAGKTPSQIFSDTCNACHRSPREIKRTTPAFLREHYTTGWHEATIMAAYLASIGSDPRAVQQRRPPVIGAGQAGPTENGTHGPATGTPDQPRAEAPAVVAGTTTAPNEQVKPAGPPPRRPLPSVEIGLPEASAETAVDAGAPQTAAIPASAYPGQDFEE
jgi:hypothetical protein